MPVYPLSNDDEIGAALNVARNPDPMGDTIQAKIGGLNQALTGLDLEANTPQFNTGIGGAGMPSAPTRQLNDIGHYSHAAEQASTLQPRGDATQMISTLKNMPGVKPEELQNAGLIDAQGNVHPEWAGRGKITREDLAGHLQSSMPEVQETVLGGNSKPSQEILNGRQRIFDQYIPSIREFQQEHMNYDLPSWEREAAFEKQLELQDKMVAHADREYPLPKPNDNPKYSDYTLPGGENYREVVLHVPNEKLDSETAGKQYYKSFYRKGGDPDWDSLTNDQKNNIISMIPSYGFSQPEKFRSGHWDQPNVLAHLRMADRTGPNGEKILHVEEIQSDWGQKGRDEGFAVPATKKMYGQVEPDDFGAYKVVWEDGSFSGGYSREYALAKAAEGKTNKQVGVPTAPYVTNTGSWTDLALKRALKEAAEGGYDKLVWTPGAEQAGRYDLSKQVGKVYYDPDLQGGTLAAEGLSGQTILDKAGVKPENIAEYIGKETAENLLKQERNVHGHHVLEGNGLKVGGEGMKEYYDKIVPNQLKKIAKHYDPNAKVGYTDVMLPPSGKAGTNNPPMAAPGLDITPQMREAIMRGQKAFQQGGRTLGNNAIDNAMRMAIGGDAKSNFSQAFASARADYLAGNGPATFNWKGKEYGVQVHGEKKLPPQAQPKRTTSTIGVDPTALHTMVSDPVVRMGGTPATGNIEEFNLAGNADLNDIYNDDHPYVAKVKAEQPTEPIHDDVSRINGPSLLDSETPIVIPHSLAEIYAQKHAADAVRLAKQTYKPTMDDVFSHKMSVIDGADPIAMPSNLDELVSYLRKHHAEGGRAHFDDGGNVRGGDSVGGLRGDTGGYSGNQGAANEGRMGDSPGGFGGDTGRYSSHDVGAEQGAINAQTARDQQNQQNERQAQQNNAAGYALRTGDVPGGFGGDSGRYSGYTNPQQGQQDAITATLQGNIQRARQQQQQAFDKYMNQIQGPESGGQGSAYNAKTGAFGAYQLMPSTALGLMQKYAPGETYRQALGTSNPADVAAGGLNAGPGYVGLTPQEQLRDVTLNQDLQRTLAEGLTRDNMATLSSAGVPINSGSLYTAHLLGAGDALKVLQSDPNTPLSQTGINPQAISNNKLEGMTAGQLLARSGSQMAATPASGVSSAGGYGRLAENVTDNSGARITDATASSDAAVTAAKAAATAQQPSIIDKIFGSTQDQIDKLAAQGQYSGMDKQQYADKFANGDPNAVKERIIYDNGQPKVDYYTKDLTQGLFGDPLKALQTGISGLFKPSTSDNGFRSSVTQPTDNTAPTYGGHGGQQAINQAIAVAQPQQVAAPAPYIAKLGNYNSQLPSTTGQTAEQWAAANTGGDMSRVNGRIKYVNGAPMLEFYSA